MYKKQTGVYSRLALLKYWCSLPTWCILLSPLSLTYSPTFTSFSPSPSLLFLLFSVLLLPPLFRPPPSPLPPSPSLLSLLLLLNFLSLLPLYLLPFTSSPTSSSFLSYPTFSLSPRPPYVPSTLHTTMLSPHLQHTKTSSSVHVASLSNNGTSKNTV